MGLGDAGAACSSRSCHSTAIGTCDLLPADQPNDACKCASGAPFSVSLLRWPPRKAAATVVVVGHLLLAEVTNLLRLLY